MTERFQGSRKHLLNFLESRDYPHSLNQLLTKADAVIELPVEGRPTGNVNPKELEIPTFCQEVCPDLKVHEKLKNWWLPHQPGGKERKGVPATENITL